ncbi:tail fiber assembly protein [Enterobacter cloacae]|nr:tail fiber assembly protein [Enterobacter cloacae]
MATDEEIARLGEWEKYSVLLSRVDVRNAPDIEWPAPSVKRD